MRNWCPECQRLDDEMLGPEKAQLRRDYKRAFREANPSSNVPDLSYKNGWWVFQSQSGFFERRVRRAQLVEMTERLRARVPD